MTQKQNQHGGYRPGAGRPKGEPTQRITVPAERVLDIRRFLARTATPVGERLLPAADAPPMPRPVCLFPVPAGFPSPADDYIDKLLDLNEYLLEHPSATFYYKVEGDSMTGAGILAGDIVVVDRSVTPRHGQIVIATVDGENTLKRLYKRSGIIELRPENPRYAPLRIGGEMELTIWGVVTGVVRKCSY